MRMSASFLSAMNTRANHFAIDEENKRLKAELAMLLKEKEELEDELYNARCAQESKPNMYLPSKLASQIAKKHGYWNRYQV